MLMQFKDYMEKAKWPMAVGGVIGVASAASSAATVILGSDGCDNSLNAKLLSEVSGSLVGAATGILLGAIHPGIQMFFGWANTKLKPVNFRDIMAIELTKNNVDSEVVGPQV